MSTLYIPSPVLLGIIDRYPFPTEVRATAASAAVFAARMVTAKPPANGADPEDVTADAVEMIVRGSHDGISDGDSAACRCLARLIYRQEVKR